MLHTSTANLLDLWNCL